MILSPKFYKITLLSLILFFISITPSLALEKGEYSLGADIDFIIFLGNIREIFEDDFGVGLNFSYGLLDSLTLKLYGGYSLHNGNGLYSLSDMNLIRLNFGPCYNIELWEDSLFYLFGGGGITFIWSSIYYIKNPNYISQEEELNFNEEDFSLTLGSGLSFFVSEQVSLYISGEYNFILFDNSEKIDKILNNLINKGQIEEKKSNNYDLVVFKMGVTYNF